MKKYILILGAFFICALGTASVVSANSGVSKKPPTQEQLDEQELEAVYGVEVERDRLGGNATAVTTRDRYGNGRVNVFQDNTKSKRNLETNDTLGVEVKLFEFK